MNRDSATAPFLLSADNVLDYLIQSYGGDLTLSASPTIELKACKNFNVLVEVAPDRYWLVKQEPPPEMGAAPDDLAYEWQLHHLVQTTPAMQPLAALMSEALYFDADRSIAIFNYLTSYRDLDEFYSDRQIFPSSIAAALGSTLAEIHRLTLNQPDLGSALGAALADYDPDIRLGPPRLTPEMFGQITADGFKFYELYQRYPSLPQAIDRLSQSYRACCLTHNDLKFNNILLHHQWQDWTSEAAQAGIESIADRNGAQPSIIRLIDWEKWSWGDPAVDVGAIIADYLKIWLKSLTLSPGISIDLALQWAATPLDWLQPSMRAFLRSYLQRCPQILDCFPNFLTRTMQFAGLALIDSLQARIQYYEPFGNIGIGMLEVAKSLLCTPEPSIAAVFGSVADIMAPEDLQLILPARTSVVEPTAPQFNIYINENSGDRSGEFFRDRSIGSLTCNIDPTVALQDIADHIRVFSDGTITHDDYQPLDISAHLHQFEQLPPDLKQSVLQTQLRNYLYDIYYSGEQPLQICNQDSHATVDSPKNDTVRGINLEFYQSIDRANQGEGYFDPGWQVVTLAANQCVVQKNGLSLHIRRHHLRPPQLAVGEGDVLDIRLPHHLLENDFYLAISNDGPPAPERPTLELCFHLTSAGAIEIMRHITSDFNSLGIPFTFKVLLHLEAYRRYDAGVLQIERQHYPLVQPTLQQIYAATRSHFRPATPFLTQPLAPGLSLAEDPPDGKEFGLHRCQLIAEALLAAQATGDETPAARLHWIEHSFSQQGIAVRRPYLNGDDANRPSYTPFEGY
jgi:hypothetical protein